MVVKTLVVGIGGASSSGKTTIAKLLNAVVPGSYLLHQDDFFKRDQDIPIDPKTGLKNWDCPEALNFDAFVKEVTHLKTTGDITHDNEDVRYDSDTKDQDLSMVSHTLLEQLRLKLQPLLEGTRLILVDGFMLFHDPDIIELFDLRIFVKCSKQTLKDRRFKRSGYQTAESFWLDPPNYFDDVVYPAYSSSHAYLFQNGNVESELDPVKQHKFNILCVNNDNDATLNDALGITGVWLVDQLLAGIDN